MSSKKKCAKTKHEKFAPGIDDALEQSATEEDQQCGNSTKVIELSWDEVDASKPGNNQE